MEPQCRLCQGSQGGELIRPCRCRGTIEFAHPRCLVEWIARKRSLECEICAGPYNIYKVTRVADAATSPPSEPPSVHGRAEMRERSRACRSQLFTASRIKRVAALTMEKLTRISVVAVPLTLSLLLPPLLFLMVYPFIRGPIEVVRKVTKASLFDQVVLMNSAGLGMVALCGNAYFWWLSWLSWCAVHRDDVALPFPAEVDVAGGGGEFVAFVQEVINALLDEGWDEQSGEAADAASAPEAVPHTEATFSSTAHAHDVDAGRLAMQHVSNDRDRDLVLSVIDRTLARGRRRPLWRHPFPCCLLRLWRGLLCTMSAIAFAVFVAPKAVQVALHPVAWLAEVAAALLLGVPRSSTVTEEGGSSSAGGALVLPTWGGHSWVYACNANLLLWWIGKVAVLRRLSPQRQNMLTTAYTLVRGVAMLITLAVTMFHVSSAAMLLLCGDFIGESAVGPLQLSPTAAWRILQDNNLAPISCWGGGSQRTQGSPTHVIQVYRALRYVRPSFLRAHGGTPDMAAPLTFRPPPSQPAYSLFLLDEESCGSFLTRLVSSYPMAGGETGTSGTGATLAGYARYIVYCLYCIYRVHHDVLDVGMVAVASLSSLPLVVAYYSDCLRGTDLYELLHGGLFHALASLSVPKTLRLALTATGVILAATAGLGRLSWTLLFLAAPLSLPLLVDQLGWLYLQWMHVLPLFQVQCMKLQWLAVSRMKSVLQQWLDVPVALLEPPLLSAACWRIPLRDALTLAAYWTAMAAGCIVLTATTLYLYMCILPLAPHPLFGSLFLLWASSHALLHDAAVWEYAASRSRRVARLLRTVTCVLVLRYAVGLDVSLCVPWGRLWHLPTRMAVAEEERHWEVIITPSQLPTRLLTLQSDLHVHLKAANTFLQQDGGAPPATAAAPVLDDSRPQLVRIVVPHEALLRLCSDVLKRYPPRLPAVSLTVAMCLLLPLSAARLPLLPMPSPNTGDGARLAVRGGCFVTWVWGCVVLATLLTVERRICRSHFVPWCVHVLPYWLFHPLSGVWHSLCIPLAVRYAAMSLWRFAFAFASALLISWRTRQLRHPGSSWPMLLLERSPFLVIWAVLPFIVLVGRRRYLSRTSQAATPLPQTHAHPSGGGGSIGHRIGATGSNEAHVAPPSSLQDARAPQDDDDSPQALRHGTPPAAHGLGDEASAGSVASQVPASQPGTTPILHESRRRRIIDGRAADTEARWTRTATQSRERDLVKAVAKRCFLLAYHIDNAARLRLRRAQAYCHTTWASFSAKLESLAAVDEVVAIAVVNHAHDDP